MIAVFFFGERGGEPSVIRIGHEKWVHVTMVRRVLRLWMEERRPVRRVAANILNKQSRTADKGCYSSLGVGRGANNSSS